ncbi:MAG: formate dehydrogenase accessory sulfurtransferase FdhD [Thermoplasmata archaeon]|nr:formate dehydrogenase accessory sulfurtransferase FdhD [Thermoplasmata archaeon]
MTKKPETKTINIVRISKNHVTRTKDSVVREFPFTIIYNDVELVTLLCSPKNLDYLATGFLFAEGLLNDKKDIKKLFVDEKKGVAWVETKQTKKTPENPLSKRFITTGCGKGISLTGPFLKGKNKIQTKISFRSDDILAMMKLFQQKSEIHKLTGGIHSAALCDAKKILVFSEDLGRHSAIDKVLGECLLGEIRMSGRIMMTSGRISSEILMKIARARIPLIVSKSAPTDLSVNLADKLGITLVGFARGMRMNIYSHDWRIVSSGRR